MKKLKSFVITLKKPVKTEGAIVTATAFSRVEAIEMAESLMGNGWVHHYSRCGHEAPSSAPECNIYNKFIFASEEN